jgi:parallel beta-helix repeat protein
MKKQTIIYLGLTLGAVISGSAATLTVDDDFAQCPGAQYNSIQAAVVAAKPGDTINVCPGTYQEQVSITKNLNVQGVNIANQGMALIKPNAVAPNSTGLVSGSPVAAVVLVDGANNVNLSNLTVDASNNQFSDCSTLLVGIYYRNSSGKADSVAVRNVTLGSGLEGCNSGYAVFVQSGNGGSANVQVTNSSIHDYQKNGIVGQEASTQLTVRGNGVTGLGANPNLAENGIELAFGAKGTIDDNLVINHIYSQCTDSQNCNAATNILLFQAGTAKVTNNSLGKSQINIALVTDNTDTNHNFAVDTDVLYGVYVVGNKNNVHENSIFNSDGAGVYVDGANNTVQNNTINETPVGVFQTTASTGTNVGGNKFFNVGVNSQTAAALSMATTASTGSARIEIPTRP